MENLAETLLEKFAAEYSGKLFYFCLKKTGDSHEAEDLASDITLNIAAALRRGTVPVNFPAWVWQIARNRYSAWAGRRRMQRESDAGADIGDFELADEGADIEGAWMHGEELRLLRRELSFIASDYRNVIVAYYIDDRSVGEIADRLRIPAGTVKSKLFRGRKMLKEGMDMAREFGTMSYRPEKVRFSCCCESFGNFNEPWCYLDRLLCKNILLAAYRTPSTAEELAVEIGVAAPYVEDELRQLTDATLLRKNGEKYETNFFILSARGQEKIYTHLKALTPELEKAVEEALEYRISCLNGNGVRWHEGYQDYEDMKWTLLMQEIDTVENEVIAAETGRQEGYETGRMTDYTSRPNGGKWDIVGYEEYEGERPESVGLHGGCIDNRYMDLWKQKIFFSQYRFAYRDICKGTREWLSFEEVDTLAKLVRREDAGLSEDILRGLEESGYVAKGETGYRPTFLVSLGSEEKGLTEEQEREYLRLRDRAKGIALRQYLFSRETVIDEFPTFLKGDSRQLAFAIDQIFGLRGAVLEEALRSGYLAYDETQPRRMLGVSMSV